MFASMTRTLGSGRAFYAWVINNLRAIWRRPGWIVGACCILSFVSSLTVRAQEPAQGTELTAEQKKEILANQRFEEILKRKPRPGTALDRVYEFHISRGSLDEYCARLNKEVKDSNNGQAALLLGLINYQRGMDGEARIAFDKAEELLPQEPLASYHLGKTLLLIGDTDGAMAALKRAIERKPEKADSLLMFKELGRLYQRLRLTDDALNVWKQMEAMFPGDLQVQEQIASVLEEEGAHAAALERFTSLAAATKDRFRKAELGVRAASLKIKLNQHDQALNDFETLLAQINPGSWLYQDIRRRIDDAFQSRHDTSGLTAYYQRWIEKHPDDVDAMMRIGRQLSVAHNSAAAKVWFSRAIERAPSAVEPRLALVEAFERDGNLTAAASAMQALVEVQPDNPDYLVRWGELLLADYTQPQSQRAAAAADVWRKLVEKHSGNPVMIARVADLMRGASLSDEAIRMYTRAIELADSEPQYREYLGEYLHRLGRRDEALKVWRSLASESRRNRDNLVRLSEVLSTFGHKEESITVMGEACQMQPTFVQRLRYIEKLIDAPRFDDAKTQLAQAASQTANEEEQDQVLEYDIKLHLASGEIASRIEQLEMEVGREENAKSPMAWKRLALFQEADGKTQSALNSINEALAASPQSANLLNIASRMQEKSGLVGDAVASLRKLITLDRRGQSRILMQIASMHVRLGQMDQAIKTAQEMLAAADAGTEQVRYYADLCFQSGKVDQGLDALRRNMRSNPNDREAIELLARALSNHFKTEEAIELYWRAFAKANNQAEKSQVVQTLTELYLRTNAFDDLVKRLESYGREENRAREAVMLTAAAHQASGDLASARQLLEPLLSSDAKDSELLSTLVEMARADGDWDAAAEFQNKLNNLSPTPEGGMQLAKFLLEKGDIAQAESIWNKYAAQKMSNEDLQNNMRQLVSSGETDKVLGMIERAVQHAPDDWEVAAICMQMAYRCQNDKLAQTLSEKILKLDVARDALGEQARLQQSRRASSAPSAPSGATPRNVAGINLPSISPAANPNATDRVSSLNRATQILQSLRIERTNPDIFIRIMGSATQAVVCFNDARFLALGIKTLTNESEPDASSRRDRTQQIARSVAQESNVDKLWDAAFEMNLNEIVFDSALLPVLLSSGTYTFPSGFGVSTSRSAITRLSPMLPALTRLAELNDHDAELYLVELALRRMQNAQTSYQAAANLRASLLMGGVDAQSLDQTLALVKKVLGRPGGGSNQRVVLLSIYIASELKSMGRQDDLNLLMPSIKQNSLSAPTFSAATAVLRLDANTAIDVFLATLKQSNGTVSLPSASKGITNQSIEVSNFLSELLDRQEAVAGLETSSADAVINRDQPLRLITELKKLQAERARRMRPSQLAAYAPGSQVALLMRSTNPARGNAFAVIPFPAPSALQSGELLGAMYMVHHYPNNFYRDHLEKLLRSEAEQVDEDPYQSAVDHLSLCVWLWWSEQRDQALQELEEVRKTSVVNDLVSMLSSRMFFEAGRPQDAMAQLEQLKPTTAQLMQERELAIVQLAMQLGQKDRAKQAVERLFAMRLPTQMQGQVKSIMQQLGMNEMAESMTQRMQRSGGNTVNSLMQQMNRFEQEGKPAAAQEIARQILRRTRVSTSAQARGSIPSTSTIRAQTPNDNARRAALRVLASAPEIKEQIAQLEEKVKNNPKSSSLINQLAELYEATGRTSDSQKLLAQLRGASTTANRTVASGQLGTPSAISVELMRYRQTRSLDSVKGYLEIFEKHPELLAREFSYFRTAVQQHKSWDLVATELAKWPIEKIPTGANWDDLLQTVALQASPSSVESLVKKLLEADDFMSRYRFFFRNRNSPVVWNEATQAMLIKRLCQAIENPAIFNTKDGQVDNNGHLRTVLSTVNQLIIAPDAARKVLDTISFNSPERPELKCAEVLLRLTAEDTAGSDKAIEELCAMPPAPNKLRAMWGLATELNSRAKSELAIPILEHVIAHDVPSGPFSTRPVNLLLTCYEAKKDFAKAKPLLDQLFAEIQKQPPTTQDPFGANGLQTVVKLGEQYLATGYRLEALGVVSWLSQKSPVLNAADSMYNSRGTNPIREQLNRLDNLIRSKLDAQAIETLVRREIDPRTAPDGAPNTSHIKLPISMLIPDISAATARNRRPHCQFRDLMSRLDDEASIKAGVQGLLDSSYKNSWAELQPRNLLSALYLADYLQQNDHYLSAAQRLDELLTAEQASLDRSSIAQEVQDAISMRAACWLVAEKLVQLRQPELAAKFAQHATQFESQSSMSILQMRLRLAQAFTETKQTDAAQKHLQVLLDQLYPAASVGP